MTTLTPSQIQRLVAETLGWTEGQPPFWNSPDPENHLWDGLPNWPGSLDACWLAFEKDAPEEYWSALADVVRGVSWRCDRPVLCFDEWIAVARATPLQRCEAFLRWKGAIL